MTTKVFQLSLKPLHLLLAFLLILSALAIIPMSTAKAAGESVQIWYTTADLSNHLSPQANQTFGNNGTPDINVDETTTYQSMDGFGAAMTDTSAWLISNKLSSANHTRLMNDLFNPTSGIGISWVRIPMAASDFSATAQPYSYDDMPAGQTDPTLSRFSINHDLAYIIPDLKEAKTLNPNLKFMANPWSPPGWMKANGQMNNNNHAGTILTSSYAPLANYFLKFLQGYQAQGVNIYAITPQNEPGLAGNYPNVEWDATGEGNFIKNNLGPTLASANLHPRILGDDFNTNTLNNFAIPLMNDPAVAQYLAGTAWHCYAGGLGNIGTMHNQFPNKDNYETECSAGIDPQNAIETFIQSTRNWSRNGTMWNIAEDSNNGPVIPGGCSPCTPLVTIDQATGNITYRLDYYAVGHFSKFVLPGALRISSNTTGSINDVAFKNPDGSLVTIAHNTSSSTQTFKLGWHGQSLSYTLAPDAIATFKWSSNGSVPLLQPVSRTGWTATASSSPTSSCCLNDVPAKALDGDTATRWSTGLAQANGQWFQINMGHQASLSQLVLDAGNGTDSPRGYQVFVSNDGVNFGGAVATGSSSGQITTINFPTINAQYFKIVQTGSDSFYWWSIAELKAYTLPLNRTGWSASASASSTIDPPSNTLDGNIATRWSSGINQANGQWFQMDLKSTQAFSQIVLDNGASSNDYPRGYQVFVSNDGVNFGAVVASGSGSSSGTIISFPHQQARYIKVVQTGSDPFYWWSIAEFNVYNN